MIASITKRPRKRRTTRPKIRFTPYAWAKLIYLRDVGSTEVGGFGISNDDDPLLIEDIVLIKQVCTSVSVEFDDESVADFFEQQVDEGGRPDQFARIWIHTHPGHSATPSGTDEETFKRCFGSVDWAVMFILSQTGQTYGRLQFNVGPGGGRELVTSVDFSGEFDGADRCLWEDEYVSAVTQYDPLAYKQADSIGSQDDDLWQQHDAAYAWRLSRSQNGAEVTQ
jgi:proteasome lid subunit RPN8/RPN11